MERTLDEFYTPTEILVLSIMECFRVFSKCLIPKSPARTVASPTLELVGILSLSLFVLSIRVFQMLLSCKAILSWRSILLLRVGSGRCCLSGLACSAGSPNCGSLRWQSPISSVERQPSLYSILALKKMQVARSLSLFDNTEASANLLSLNNSLGYQGGWLFSTIDEGFATYHL